MNDFAEMLIALSEYEAKTMPENPMTIEFYWDE